MNLGTRFLAAPFVKRCGTDAVLPTEFGDRVTAFCLLENGDDWLSEKRDVFMQNFLGLLWRKFYF
jgi:hypothetical protein